MPRPARRPPRLRGTVFRGSQAVTDGLLTRNELRSSAWRPLFRDIYADAELPVPHRTRCALVARWLIPDGAAIAGRSAACLYGATSLDEKAPVEVVVPAGTRFGPVAGLRIHSTTLADQDVRRRDGVPLTTAHRTCCDLARWLDPVEAVTMIDQFLARRIVTAPGLRDYALARAGDRGLTPCAARRRPRRPGRGVTAGVQAPGPTRAGRPPPPRDPVRRLRLWPLRGPARPGLAGGEGGGRVRRPLARRARTVPPRSPPTQPAPRQRLDRAARDRPAPPGRLRRICRRTTGGPPPTRSRSHYFRKVVVSIRAGGHCFPEVARS